jgi:hypothetical protein
VNNDIKHPERNYVSGFGIFVVKNNTGLLFEMLPSQPAPLVSQGDHLPAPPQELLSLRGAISTIITSSFAPTSRSICLAN